MLPIFHPLLCRNVSCGSCVTVSLAGMIQCFGLSFSQSLFPIMLSLEILYWWWWLPECHHIVFSLSTHLGLLRRDITESFVSSIRILHDRVDRYHERQSCAGHEPNTTLFLHMTVVENNHQQLLTLESSFHQICLCLVEMQNTYHFALAALDWLEVFVPRYNGLTPSVSEVADVIGAFVYDIKQASHLVRCGVPVWIVCRFGDLSATRVDELLP